MDVVIEPQEDGSKLSKSCTECAKRKKKCDKVAPICGGCIARGVAHLCRIELADADQDVSTLDSTSLRVIALSELQGLKYQAAAFTNRIKRLERILAPLCGNTIVDPSAFETIPSMEVAPAMIVKPEESAPPSVASTSKAQLHDEPLESEASLAAAEEQAGIALEFMALGRLRPVEASSEAQDLTAASLDSAIVASPGTRKVHPHAQLPSPVVDFPTPASWASVAPDVAQARLLISHVTGGLGWLIAVIHQPTFNQEFETFLATASPLHPRGAFESASPSWLALYFSLLLCSIKNCPNDLKALLRIDDAEATRLAQSWFNVTVSCLYRQNFLEHHNVYALQAIAVLALSGRDAWSATTIAVLLNCALSIAQDMGIHQLESNASWETKSAALSPSDRTASLIAREVKKRVLYALIREDWFAIAYRRSFALRPSQISTPPPLNAHDLDLSAGLAIDRPLETFTISSWIVIKNRLARFIQIGFENLDTHATLAEAYPALQRIDEEMAAFIRGVPQWLQPDGPLEGLPPHGLWMRTIFAISSHHKILTTHRPFFHRAVTDGAPFDLSRARYIESARIILRNALHIGDCRVWTILYHISAAAFVVCLNLFHNEHSTLPAFQTQRAEARAAIDVLRRAESSSEIANRGVQLVSKLLDEDERMTQRDPTPPTTTTEGAASVDPTPRPNLKRPRSEESTSDTFPLDWLGLEGVPDAAPGAYAEDERLFSSLFLRNGVELDQEPTAGLGAIEGFEADGEPFFFPPMTY